MRERLSFLLGKLHLRVLDLEAAELAELDLTVKQHAVLTLLADEGPMTQQGLGHRLGIDRTTIVDLVDVVEGRGLVERRRNPADRRAYLLTLTGSGVALQVRGAELVDIAQRKLLGALNGDDRVALVSLLARALDGSPGDVSPARLHLEGMTGPSAAVLPTPDRQ